MTPELDVHLCYFAPPRPTPSQRFRESERVSRERAARLAADPELARKRCAVDRLIREALGNGQTGGQGV